MTPGPGRRSTWGTGRKAPVSDVDEWSLYRGVQGPDGTVISRGGGATPTERKTRSQRDRQFTSPKGFYQGVTVGRGCPGLEDIRGKRESPEEIHRK